METSAILLLAAAVARPLPTLASLRDRLPGKLTGAVSAGDDSVDEEVPPI